MEDPWRLEMYVQQQPVDLYTEALKRLNAKCGAEETVALARARREAVLRRAERTLDRWRPVLPR